LERSTKLRSLKQHRAHTYNVNTSKLHSESTRSTDKGHVRNSTTITSPPARPSSAAADWPMRALI